MVGDAYSVDVPRLNACCRGDVVQHSANVPCTHRLVGHDTICHSFEAEGKGRERDDANIGLYSQVVQKSKDGRSVADYTIKIPSLHTLDR